MALYPATASDGTVTQHQVATISWKACPHVTPLCYVLEERISTCHSKFPQQDLRNFGTRKMILLRMRMHPVLHFINRMDE